MPREEREALEQWDEVSGFLNQSRISPKNRQRLAALTKSPSAEVAKQAELILEIARVTPYRKRRLKILQKIFRNC